VPWLSKSKLWTLKFWPQLRAAAWLSGLLVLLGLGLVGTTPMTVLRERVFDLLLQHRRALPPAATPMPRVMVIDIDRTTLDRVGSWPWSRERLAHLTRTIAQAAPKALAFDILLAGPDERSAGALARQLAASVGDARTQQLALALAGQLPDADRVLADALQTVPAVLGLVLDPDAGGEAPAAVPMLTRGKLNLTRLWVSESAIGANPVLAAGARGNGVIALAGDADGLIRRVPLLVATATGPRPGLALEAVRVAGGAASYLLRGPLGGARAGLTTGSVALALPNDGMLRLRPRTAAQYTQRSISAAELLDSQMNGQPNETGPTYSIGHIPEQLAERLRGAIVLIGSSAPELGGLRPAISGELVASVQIQADAIEQILRADVPLRGEQLIYFEVLAAFVLTMTVTGLGLVYAPLVIGAGTMAVAGGWFVLAGLAVNRFGVLLDPLLVPVAVLAGYGVAALMAATLTRRREAFIRHRFEQHLAPAVVARIVDQPHLLKLSGEIREVTALFADIEGFTALTERAGPVELIAILDRYFDGASRIVVEHGGMIEKIVGDGFHALFNAPLDLADHPRCAIDCARAIHAFAEDLRQEPDAARLLLGRTRIGIESGPVIVGDVGGGRRLDYTAHGNTMNRAARLEAANKELGSSICIGPVAASLLDPALLRPLGPLSLRGVQKPLHVFTLADL
jgi:adenylate cyclase